VAQKTTFHLVPCEYYEAQPDNEPYRPEPMVNGKEEFIHCTDGTQNLVDTANRYFRSDPRPFFALIIDLEKVTAPVKYEDERRIYPHIYGSLNRDAITGKVLMERDLEGNFLPPHI
jgi:uncharacterized protein (DUF952 family)